MRLSTLLGTLSACSGDKGTSAEEGGKTGGSASSSSGTSSSSSAATSAGGATGAGTSATSGTASAGGSSGTASTADTGSATSATSSGSAGSNGATGPVTITCERAAGAYTLSTASLDASLVPHVVTRGFGSDLFAEVPVAVDPSTGTAYVGFTRDAGGGTLSSVIVPATDGASAPVVTVAGAAMGGIAVTKDGFGALVFDPNDTVDDRTWAAVQRFDSSGAMTFDTELFHSANLTDEGTKGAPSTSRFAYLPSGDQLVAYFAHTEMIQGVRHQGGYLATLGASGTQTVVSDWWGSHNLDQRVIVAGSQVGLLGLGDAYPKGIFFSFLGSRPQTHVVYTLAGDGQGTTNGQLGGMVDLGDSLTIPFITNDSIAQTLTPGDWPDIDQTIADQIDTAAANGNKLGLLSVPKMGALPSGDLAPMWLDPSLAAGAHLTRLKSARYGASNLLLLAWAEESGTGRNVSRNFFTMIVDGTGAICQPKTALPAAAAFTAGDDFVLRPDGAILWSSVSNNRISLITLTPG